MDGRDELLGVQQAEEVRPLQPLLDEIARRMLFIVALFTPFFLFIRLAPLLGGNQGPDAIRQLVTASIAIALVVVATFKRDRLSAKQIGWTIAVLAAYIGIMGIYKLGTNTALTSFVFISLMSLALFVGRRQTLVAGISMWLFAIVMTLVRNQEQLADLSQLMDTRTGMIGVGSGFGSGILVVILIAEILPGLLEAVERALTQRSEERQRRWYAEARSEQLQLRWQSYFERASIGLIITDETGGIVGWSHYNEPYIGVPAGEIIGQPIEDVIRDIDVNSPLLPKVQGLLAGQSFTGYVLELATERGIRRILLEGDPLLDETGALEGTFIAAVDITPLMADGEGTEDGDDGDKPLVLGKQNTLASLSNKLLGIRSALMSSGLSAEALNTELAQTSPSTANLASRSKTLTEQHVQATKLADAAFALITEEPERNTAQHAGPLAGAAVTIFRTRAEREGIEIDLDDAFAEDALISVPPVLVRQILINLISNAREAISRSEKASERRILIRISAEGESVVFIVEDTAGSVLPVNRDVYFNPTYSTKGEREGSGKGLYVSRHTAERLGGQLDVEQGEQGLRFVLTLPRHLDDTVEL